MDNIFAALGSALYSRLSSAGTIPAYQDLAPQGNPVPFVIFQQQSATDEYTFDTSGVLADYVVKVISDRQNPTQATLLYSHIHDGLQDAPLDVNGYSLLRCRRQSTIKYRDPDGFWHVGGLYRIDVQS